MSAFYQLGWNKKEVLIPFLKKQIRDLSEMIDKIETNDIIEDATVLEFFYQKKKDERKLVQSIFNI